MLLLTLTITLAPGRRSPARDTPLHEETVARVTKLSLAEALAWLKRYEIAFNRDHTGPVISHRLLQVQLIDDVFDHELLANFSVFWIEAMTERLEAEREEEAKGMNS